ncbi:hypothetical protein C0J52_16961 [Blattella germanica]|nr:hypothetical protein C0J52_16961 [Blattella germanica]
MYGNDRGKDRNRERKRKSHTAHNSKVFAASSLWCTYSKLKTILRVREKVDVSSFTNVVSFLKKMSVRHVPRKSNVLSRSQIDEFLLNAPDDVFLLIKVVTALGCLEIIDVKSYMTCVLMM